MRPVSEPCQGPQGRWKARAGWFTMFPVAAYVSDLWCSPTDRIGRCDARWALALLLPEGLAKSARSRDNSLQTEAREAL